jgi:hypothetical protein
MMNGYNVVAEQAKPHYAFKILEAKRQRERAAQEAEEERQRAVDAMNERLETQGNTITVANAPKPFYHGKQRYGRIASEIAKKIRLERGGAPSAVAPPPSAPQHGNQAQSRGGKPGTSADAGQGGRPAKKARAEKKGSDPVKSQVEPEKKEEPAGPPQPTKDQRKLAGLQAKLQALKDKMKR